MFALVTPIRSLLSGVGLVLLGTGLLNTLLVLRGSAEGFSSLQLGLIMSSYFAGYLIGTHFAMRLIGRIGYIRAFAFSGSILAASILLHALWVNFLFWTLLRILTGVALVTLYTLIESWLNQQSTSATRGRIFAIYMGVNLTALALTQQFINLASVLDMTLFVLSSLLVILALIPIMLTRMVQPTLQQSIRIDLRKVFNTAPLAAVASGMSGLVMGAFWGMLALYAARIGMSTPEIAGFLTIAILGGAVMQLPWGRYSDTQDRRKVLMYVALFAGISAFLLVIVSHWYVQYWLLLALVVFLYGGCAFAIYPIAVAHLVDQLEEGEILGACAGNLMIHGACAAIGPALAGQLMSIWGAQALPAYFLVINLSLALFCLMEIRSPFVLLQPGKHIAQFIPMLRTTPVVMALYPPLEKENPEPDDHGSESNS